MIESKAPGMTVKIEIEDRECNIVVSVKDVRFAGTQWWVETKTRRIEKTRGNERSACIKKLSRFERRCLKFCAVFSILSFPDDHYLTVDSANYCSLYLPILMKVLHPH